MFRELEKWFIESFQFKRQVEWSWWVQSVHFPFHPSPTAEIRIDPIETPWDRFPFPLLIYVHLQFQTAIWLFDPFLPTLLRAFPLEEAVHGAGVVLKEIIEHQDPLGLSKSAFREVSLPHQDDRGDIPIVPIGKVGWILKCFSLFFLFDATQVENHSAE